MPEINLNNGSVKDFQSGLQQEPVDTNTILQKNTESVGVNENGMTQEELNDANKIQVTIANYDVPLVVLFGPPACGKTMTLIRLTRYLNKQGYEVRPVRSFRPSYDVNYKNMCEHFDEMVSSPHAAASTDKISFMLIEVLRNNKPLCQILEGPGEYYFDPQEPKAEFPKYVNVIINSDNRKIWVIMVEPDSTNDKMDATARANYVSKIAKLKKRIHRRNKIVFVYNKIDQTPFVSGQGEINYISTIDDTKYRYPGIFEQFRNSVPITKWFKPYNFDFVAFQTGDFSVAGDGTRTFDEGNDLYPRKLWEVISKRIRG